MGNHLLLIHRAIFKCKHRWGVGGGGYFTANVCKALRDP